MRLHLRRDDAPSLRPSVRREPLALPHHAATRRDCTDALLALMNLEIWSRIYLDRRTPDDVAAELHSFVA